MYEYILFIQLVVLETIRSMINLHENFHKAILSLSTIIQDIPKHTANTMTNKA